MGHVYNLYINMEKYILMANGKNMFGDGMSNYKFLYVLKHSLVDAHFRQVRDIVYTFPIFICQELS